MQVVPRWTPLVLQLLGDRTKNRTKHHQPHFSVLKTSTGPYRAVESMIYATIFLNFDFDDRLISWKRVVIENYG